MKVTIRKATLKDLTKIQHLSQCLFDKEYSEFNPSLNCNWIYGVVGTNYFKDCITKKEKSAFVAICNKKIVGYLTGGIEKVVSWRKIVKCAELYNMFVLEEFRSLGVGKKLYCTFLSWAKKNNVKKLQVIVTAKNARAINFYKKNGFSDYEVILEQDL
jgi:diamine N-acetyltransferase